VVWNSGRLEAKRVKAQQASKQQAVVPFPYKYKRARAERYHVAFTKRQQPLGRKVKASVELVPDVWSLPVRHILGPAAVSGGNCNCMYSGRSGEQGEVAFAEVVGFFGMIFL
jgi:hypothetical protein